MVAPLVGQYAQMMRTIAVTFCVVVAGSVQALPQLGGPVNMTVPSMNNGLPVRPSLAVGTEHRGIALLCPE